MAAHFGSYDEPNVRYHIALARRFLCWANSFLDQHERAQHDHR